MKKIQIINNLSQKIHDNIDIIICLSLDTYLYYKNQSNVKHINEIVNLDEIYYESYLKSYENKLINHDIFNYLLKIDCNENSFFIYEYHYSLLIKNKLLEIYNENEYTIILPTANTEINTIWCKNHQINLKKSNLFYNILNKNIDNLEEKYTSLLNSKIKVQINYDKKIKCNNNINYQISKLRNTNSIIDNWGMDLHKLINYNRFCKSIKKQKILNICYRINKIKDFKNYNTKNIQTLIINEDIRNGQTYGIHLNNFNSKEKGKLIKKYNRLFNKLKTNLLTDNIHVKYNLLTNLFFICRIYIINELLYNKIFTQTKPKTYVSSDATFSLLQIGKIISKNYNIKTISYPHSPKLYIHSKYNYELNDLSLFNINQCNNVCKNIYNLNSNVLGLSKDNYKIKKFIKKDRYNLVIGTRSWGGFYHSISFNPLIYNNELNNLIKKSKNYNIIIKSHPNGDITDYYNLLQKKFKNVSHISNGWRYDEFLKNTDFLIVFELPSFVPQALFSNIPIIWITSSITKVLKDLLHYPINDFNCIKDSNEACEVIQKIINDDTYRNKYLNTQNEFIKNNIPHNPENNLINLL